MYQSDLDGDVSREDQGPQGNLDKKVPVMCDPKEAQSPEVRVPAIVCFRCHYSQ